MTFYPVVIADNVTTASTGDMIVGRDVLNNGAKALLIHGRHRLQAKRQLHVEGYVGWLQQYILGLLIGREDKVSIRTVEGIKLGKFANKVTGIARCDSTFVDLTKKILTLAIAFGEEYNEKFVVTRVVHIVKDMMGTDVLAGMSDQFSYRYMRVVKMISRHESVSPLVKNLDCDDAGSKSLGSSDLVDTLAVHGDH